MTQRAETSQTFAEKLRFLFYVVRHPSGREYNVTEVAEALNANGQHQISRAYINALKEGTRTTPSPEFVEALASFFGVPAAYFFDNDVTRWVEQQLQFVSALRDASVRHISMEAFGLSPASLGILAETIKHIRKLEGLPESSREPAPRRRRWRRKRDETEGTGPDQGGAAPTG